MKHVDVVELTQEAVAQTMGTDYMNDIGDFSGVNSYKLIDIGKDVLDGGTIDVYAKKLLGLLGKMVIDAKSYEGAGIDSIFVDSFDWGSFVERVYFTPQDLIEDDMWNLIDGKVYENDHKFFAPKVAAKLFEEAKSITTPISIVEEQLRTAFTGWEQMNTFLSGIRTNVENTIKLALQAYAHMLIGCGIAISAEGTGTAVHMVTEAIAAGILEAGTTYDTAKYDESFNIFCMERIKTIRDNMRIYSSAYNNGEMPTFTNESDNKMILLTQFENSLKFQGKRQVYNLDQIGIGNYETTPMWQGIRETAEGATTNFAWDTVSSVSINADASNKLGLGTSAIEVNDVAGIIFDHRAMGVCPYRRKVTSQYTASADFWNEFHHLLVNYILDTNFNIVAICMD